MILLLKLILITFILVMALKIVTSEGMLLEKVGKYLKRQIEKGNKLADLGYCEWCTSTPMSIVAHFFAFGLGVLPFQWNWQLLIRWPLVVGGASFLSGMAWTIYLTINDIKENNEAQAKYFKNLNSEPPIGIQ